MKVFAVSLPDYPADSSFAFKGKTVGDVVSSLIPYIYTIAGLAVLLMLIWGGLTLMTAAGDPAKTKAGYGKITGALIGFAIIFVSYFVVQIVEIALGIKVL